jgi:hypothetical protein
MILINRLHLSNETCNSEYNYYSIKIINNKSESHEIISFENQYLFSLNELPLINIDISNMIINDCQKMLIINYNNDLYQIINLIINSLINQYDINIYQFSELYNKYILIKDIFKLEDKNNLNKFIIKSKCIDMSLFYQILYSLKIKLKIGAVFNKDKIYWCDDFKVNNLKNKYNINDYQNLGREYSKICNALLNDLRSELYLK